MRRLQATLSSMANRLCRYYPARRKARASGFTRSWGNPELFATLVSNSTTRVDFLICKMTHLKRMTCATTRNPDWLLCEHSLAKRWTVFQKTRHLLSKATAVLKKRKSCRHLAGPSSRRWSPPEKPDYPVSVAVARLYDQWNPHEDRGNELYSNFKYSPLKGLEQKPNISRRDPTKVLLIDGVYHVWYTGRRSVVRAGRPEESNRHRARHRLGSVPTSGMLPARMVGIGLRTSNPPCDARQSRNRAFARFARRAFWFGRASTISTSRPTVRWLAVRSGARSASPMPTRLTARGHTTRSRRWCRARLGPGAISRSTTRARSCITEES